VILLVFEDNTEEQKNAKRILRDAGFQVALADNLKDGFRLWDKLGDKLGGIITDMMFPDGYFRFDESAHACGLAVIARAVKENVAVTVCSDLDHHGVIHLVEVIKALQEHPNNMFGKIPFIMDRKNWNLSLNNLQFLLKQKEKA